MHSKTFFFDYIYKGKKNRENIFPLKIEEGREFSQNGDPTGNCMFKCRLFC